MSPRPKRTEFAVTVAGTDRAMSDGRSDLAVPEDWTPEHLVLAGLASCLLTSLRYHARRAELDYTATAEANGAVMTRDDGRWGFVEIGCTVDLRIDPVPDTIDELIATAELGCFIGTSLDPPSAYRWRVNGADHSY